MKRMKVFVIIFGVLLVLALSAGLFFRENYLILDGKAYQKDVTSLDLSGKTLQDLQIFTQFSQLQQLDLRNTGLTVAEYEELQKLLPDCQIQWLLPFQGGFFPLDTREIAVSTLTEADIYLLSYLPALQRVDATGCKAYDTLLLLKEQYPQLDVAYALQLGNDTLREDATHFASASLEHIQTALCYLPKLETVDAAGCTDFDALLALQAQYPHCRFRYQVPFCGQFWQEDTTHMDLKSVRAEDLAKALRYLPDVKTVTVAEPITDPEHLVSLFDSHPELEITCSFELFGQTLTADTVFLDISDVPLESVAQLEDYLPLLPNLEKVDMCRCGIENEEMFQLNQRYPDTLFVWEVQMGNFYLRTDIIYFMPWQYRYQLTDADADTLKYFSELICIDFGHMNISRTDYLEYMPKLQFLMMCDTRITDISYLANMKDLKYVELFITDITDFSPLLECKSLVDLNICYTNPDDPMIFAQMTWLENFWFRGMQDPEIIAALRAALPNTRTMFGPGSSTGRGWRRLPNYYAQRDLMGMPYMEEP